MSRAMMTAFSERFFEEAQALVLSFKLYNPDHKIYCFAVNCSNTQLRWIEDNNIIVYAKDISFEDSHCERCYMSSRRFILWHYFMTTNSNIQSVIALDADSIVTSKINKIYDYLNIYDILFDIYFAKDGRQCINAGCLVMSNNSVVIDFLDKCRKCYINKKRKHGWRWRDDQKCITHLYRKYEDFSGIRFGKLPVSFNGVERDTIIYQARGRRKNSPFYLDLKKKFLEGE